eukprot:scaffold42355_cov62-Phaeocystis_antarctica.AAC.3
MRRRTSIRRPAVTVAVAAVSALQINSILRAVLAPGDEAATRSGCCLRVLGEGTVPAHTVVCAFVPALLSCSVPSAFRKRPDA